MKDGLHARGDGLGRGYGGKTGGEINLRRRRRDLAAGRSCVVKSGWALRSCEHSRWKRNDENMKKQGAVPKGHCLSKQKKGMGSPCAAIGKSLINKNRKGACMLGRGWAGTGK